MSMRIFAVAVFFFGVLGTQSTFGQPALETCTVDNPVSEIEGFMVSNGIAEWSVSMEYLTAGYVLEGSATSNGPWTQIGAMELPGNAQYFVDISGSAYGFIRLVEVEATGSRFISGVVTPGLPASSGSPLPSRAELIADLDSLEQGWQTSNVTVQSTGIKYVIFTPGLFLQDVQNFVAQYWETHAGYVPIIINTDAYPQAPNHDGFRQAVKAEIANQAATGAKYFHLIGDWNDWREFTDPLVYPSLWVGPWATIRNDLLAGDYPPGQPERDLIPSYIVPDTRSPDHSMSGIPYSFTDQDYADTNGDNVPDVVVTRWPVANDIELLSTAFKMQVYNETIESTLPHTVTLYVYDQEFLEGSGDGLRAAAVADAVASEIQGGQTVFRANRSDYTSDGEWSTEVLNTWNWISPEVIVLIASRSNRNFPARISLQLSQLTARALPLVVGASCSTADFARTERANVQPASHRWLIELNAGPIAWVGPTQGSWQDGNELIAKTIMNELFAVPNRPMAEAWLTAIQSVIAIEPEEHIITTARSYVYLGDPLTPLKRQPDVATSIDERAPKLWLGLAQNHPNPFNPLTRIAFSTTRKGHLSLKIYDARGRLVRTLIDESMSPGQHETLWHGLDKNGNNVGSGVYLYRLIAEETSFSRKMTIVK